MKTSKLSLDLSSSTKIALFFFFSLYYINVTNSSSSVTPKATPTDLLNILGSIDQASSVNSDVYDELWSCLKFLAPFDRDTTVGPGSSDIEVTRSRSMLTSVPGLQRTQTDDENQLISSPPQSILDFARLAFDANDFNGTSRALRGIFSHTLNSTRIPVPDIEGSNEDMCTVVSCSFSGESDGRHFVEEEVNEYMKFLFDMIVSRGPSVGLDVSLNRYDLHHGHLFVTRETRRLGILFHAKEYPAFDARVFPERFSNCQQGSSVHYDDKMNLRNILWLAPLPIDNTGRRWAAPSVLVVLDAHPRGIIYRDLINAQKPIVRTFDQGILGLSVMDVNYLNVGGVESPRYELFVC